MISFIRMAGMNNKFCLLVAILEPELYPVPNSFLARAAKGNRTCSSTDLPEWRKKVC